MKCTVAVIWFVVVAFACIEVHFAWKGHLTIYLWHLTIYLWHLPTVLSSLQAEEGRNRIAGFNLVGVHFSKNSSRFNYGLKFGKYMY